MERSRLPVHGWMEHKHSQTPEEASVGHSALVKAEALQARRHTLHAFPSVHTVGKVDGCEMETPALLPTPLSSVPIEVLGVENSFLLATKSLSTARPFQRVFCIRFLFGKPSAASNLSVAFGLGSTLRHR